MLEAKSLTGQSFVFDLRLRNWITVNEIQVLLDTHYDFAPAPIEERPSFMPPHKLPHDMSHKRECSDYQYLLNYYRKKSKKIDESIRESEKISSLENEKLQAKIINLETEIEVVTNKAYAKEELKEELETILHTEKQEKLLILNKYSELEAKLAQREEEFNQELEIHKKRFEKFESEHYLEASNVNKYKNEIFKLEAKVKSYRYALDVEKQKYEEIKNVYFETAHNSNITFNQELLEKLTTYLTEGPPIDDKSQIEIDTLNKKISFLLEENDTKDEFYKKQLDSLKDTLSNELENKKNLESEVNSYQQRLRNNDQKVDTIIQTSSEESERYKFKYMELKDSYEKLERKLQEKTSFLNDPTNEKYIKDELLVAVKEKEQLEAENTELKKWYEHFSVENGELKQDLEKTQLKKETLKSKNKELVSIARKLEALNKTLSENVSKYEKKANAYKEEYKKLSAKNEAAISKLQDQKSKLSEISSEKDTIKQSIESEMDKLKTELATYKDRFETEQDVTKQLKIDLAQMKDSGSQINKELQLVAKEEDEQELNRLIGDSFEVDQDLLWQYEQEDGQFSKDLTFKEIRALKADGHISDNTKVKKGQERAILASEIFEMFMPFITYGSGENERYFIKRASVRVPFHEMISFEMSGTEFKGYCTSISAGGIFIELTKIDEEVFKIDRKGRVFFPQGTLDHPFNCIGQIKNISDKRPKGIGLMFIDLPEQAKEDILSYVNNFLNKSKKAA